MPKALSEMISDDLYNIISSGKRFHPGSKLPNEIELSKELNVNRATLRVAIRILVTKGVLEIKRGRGTFVREDFDPENIEKMQETLFYSEIEASVKDLYELRIAIEPEAAYIATKRGTEKEINYILEIGEILEQKLYSNSDRTKEEQEFHKAIAKATHNEYINKIMPILVKDIEKAVYVTSGFEDLRQETIRDHRLIMDFMKRRDAEGAKAAMRLHMVHAINLMTERVEK
jgi:GntR family transcriptional repressor for pyruvate dehydrogenase complex